MSTQVDNCIFVDPDFQSGSIFVDFLARLPKTAIGVVLFLVLNIGSDEAGMRRANRDDAVPALPLKASCRTGIVLVDYPRRDTFHGLNEIGDIDCCRQTDQQMHMVFDPADADDFGLHFSTLGTDHSIRGFLNRADKQRCPIPSRPDKMIEQPRVIMRHLNLRGV
jgi:hypothetical protein